MPRGDQLDRQWKIIQALIASGRGRTVQELADELDCNLRSVYRDLDVLQSAGFPLCNDKIDGRKVWTVLDTCKQSIPLPLDLQELMALYFSLDMLRALHDSFLYASLESLFDKIRAMLPPQSASFLQNFQHALRVDERQYRHCGRLNPVITAINEAIMKGRSVDIIYFAMSRKSRTKRIVDPYRLWFINGTFYLIGYCHLRGEVRTFSLDRIRTIEVTDACFTVPADFNFDEIMGGGFGACGGVPQAVKIHFSAEIAGYIEEKIWHASQVIEHLPDGSILFRAELALNEELENWVLGWGSRARVLEPDSLRHRLLEEARKLCSSYENSPDVPN